MEQSKTERIAKALIWPTLPYFWLRVEVVQGAAKICSQQQKVQRMRQSDLKAGEKDCDDNEVAAGPF